MAELHGKGMFSFTRNHQDFVTFLSLRKESLNESGPYTFLHLACLDNMLPGYMKAFFTPTKMLFFDPHLKATLRSKKYKVQLALTLSPLDILSCSH